MDLNAVQPDHEPPDDAALAASPSLTPPDARPELHVHGWDLGDPCDEEELVSLVGRASWTGQDDADDLVADHAIAADAFPEGGTDHVSQCHQNTWQASDVDEASA